MMKTIALHCSLLACALAAAAGATTIVVPPAYQNLEAPSRTWVPFGKSTPVRLQQVYDGTNFPAGNLVLTGLAFRADKDGQASAAKKVDLEITAGVRPSGLKGLSIRFATNRPAGMTTLVTRKQVSIPAQTPGTGPRPFDMGVLFDVPITYDRTRGALLVEIIVHGQQGSSHSCDLTYLNNSSRADFGAPGCLGSNSKVPLVRCATVNVYWGEKIFLELQDLPAGAAGAIITGSQEQGQWAGLQLPHPLTPYGAPGCTLNTDILFAGLGQAGSTGRLAIPLTLPAHPVLMGYWIRFQGMVQDFGANSLGLTFTRGRKVQVSGPEPVARIYAYDLQATTGAYGLGLAAVTRFSAR
jgi:hypothetical protein